MKKKFNFKQALHLYHMHDLSIKEIADQMREKYNRVFYQLKKVLKEADLLDQAEQSKRNE